MKQEEEKKLSASFLFKPLDVLYFINYNMSMYEIIQSATFSKWLSEIKDQQTRMRILVRLDRAMFGNFGDTEPVGEGLSELRIHYGPGYRLYYLQRDMRVVMLCGGDKASQQRDIEKAKKIAKKMEELNYG